MRVLHALFKNESGATAIEYALIASIISIAAVLALKSIGSSLTTTFNSVSANFSR